MPVKNTVKDKKGNWIKFKIKESLKYKFPKIAKEWDHERNNNVKTEDISPKDVKSYYWKCKKNHSWTTTAYHRTISKTGCPICKRPTSTPEIRIYCELINHFPNIKNRFKIKNREIDIYLPDEKVAIEYDGFYYHKDRQKEDLKKNKFYKDNKIYLIRIREGDLNKISEKDIASDKFGITKNTTNKIFETLYIKKFLSKKIFRDYVTKKKFINNSLYKKIVSELPAPPFKESIAFKYPELAKEFDIEKNKPFKASYFRPGSHSRVYWICSNDSNHKWKQSVTNRALRKSRCPKCRKFNFHINIDYKKSLKYRSPKLAKEFDLSKNKPLTPETITVNWSKNLFWICKNNNNHKWSANVKNRYWNKSGCPICRYINAKGKNLNRSMTKTRVLYNIKRTKDLKIKQKWINKLKEFS